MPSTDVTPAKQQHHGYLESFLHGWLQSLQYVNIRDPQPLGFRIVERIARCCKRRKSWRVVVQPDDWIPYYSSKARWGHNPPVSKIPISCTRIWRIVCEKKLYLQSGPMGWPFWFFLFTTIPNWHYIFRREAQSRHFTGRWDRLDRGWRLEESSSWLLEIPTNLLWCNRPRKKNLCQNWRISLDSKCTLGVWEREKENWGWLLHLNMSIFRDKQPFQFCKCENGSVSKLKELWLRKRKW